MGSNCSSHKNPDLSNVCNSQELGRDTIRHRIDGFCAPFNSDIILDGLETRRKFCRDIGGKDNNEWEYLEEGDSCGFNGSDPKSGVDFGAGCCHGSCGFLGAGVVCKRIAYNGDPNTCCFRDLEYNRQNQYCFDNKDERSTCNPRVRNMVGDGCRNQMDIYCSGSDIQDDNEWIEEIDKRWDPDNEQSCIYVLNRNLFGNPNTPGLLSEVPIDPCLFTDPSGFRYVQDLLSKVFERYSQAGFQIGALPGFNGYNQFQDTLIYPLCATTPGLCQDSLNLVCQGITLEELTRNPQLVKWCGCYLNNIEYSRYIDEYQINKECTPPCARQGNIPLANDSGFGIKFCNQSVCIIDDVTIALEASNTGSVNFSQFCGACSGPAQGSGTSSSTSTCTTNSSDTNSNVTGSTNNVVAGSCQCIINNVNIDTAGSLLGGIDLNEVCGSDTQCFRPNPDSSNPPVVSVACDAPNNINPNNTPENEAQRRAEQIRILRLALIVVGIILGIVLLLTFLYFISNYGKDTKPKVINQNAAVSTQKHDLPQSLYSNTGNPNIGTQSLYSNTANPNMGTQSIYSNNANPNIGTQSIYNNNTAKSNIGTQSLYSNNGKHATPQSIYADSGKHANPQSIYNSSPQSVYINRSNIGTQSIYNANANPNTKPQSISNANANPNTRPQSISNANSKPKIGTQTYYNNSTFSNIGTQSSPNTSRPNIGTKSFYDN